MRPISELFALALSGQYGRFISRNFHVNFILIHWPASEVKSMLNILKALDISF